MLVSVVQQSESAYIYYVYIYTYAYIYSLPLETSSLSSIYILIDSFLSSLFATVIVYQLCFKGVSKQRLSVHIGKCMNFG